MLLFRINPSGRLDDTFGNNGKFQPDHNLFNISTLAFDSDGNILAAGQMVTPNFLSVTRLTMSSPVVSLSNASDLFVTGTDGADNISLEHQDVTLIVDLNGTTSSFNFSDVKQFTVFPSAGGDVITVPFTPDCNIDGGTGNDTISVGDGDMTLTGRNGNNIITTGNGNDLITTGNGNDTIYTGNGLRQWE